MTGAAPKVSVILPLFNAAAFLDETIESVLAQTFTDFELLIVDDGSSDGSYEKAQGWTREHPDRIRLYTHPDHANCGVSATRNLGMARANADLFAYIDADDTWPVDKLSQQVALFDRYPELGLAGGAALYWGSWNGGDDWLVVAGHRPDALIPPVEAALHTYPLGKAQAPCPSTLMVRRALIEKVGGCEDEFRTMYEDQVLLVKCYVGGYVYLSSETLCNYRQHPGSIMATMGRNDTYHDARKDFLRWFDSYLQREKNSDIALLKKLRRAQFEYGNPLQRLLAKLTAR